jgi:hypothetical protein
MATKKTAKKTEKKTVLVLRTCGKNGRSHGGFKWPKCGVVECHDWSDVAECGAVKVEV